MNVTYVHSYASYVMFCATPFTTYAGSIWNVFFNLKSTKCMQIHWI